MLDRTLSFGALGHEGLQVMSRLTVNAAPTVARARTRLRASMSAAEIVPVRNPMSSWSCASSTAPLRSHASGEAGYTSLGWW